MTAIDMLGTRVSVIIGGFARQKRVAGPAKKAKRLALKNVPAMSQSASAKTARLRLAEAGISARGSSFEDVISTVRRLAGADYGGRANAAKRKVDRHARADANVAKMRAELAGVVVTAPTL